MAALLDNYQQSFVALILKTQFAIRSLQGSRDLCRTQGTIVFEDVTLPTPRACRCREPVQQPDCVQVEQEKRKNRIASRIGDNPVFVCVLSG